eukprot:403348093
MNASVVQAQTQWTDMFYYFNQFDSVREGAFKQLFGNPNDPAQECYSSFQFMRLWFGLTPDLGKLSRGDFFKGIKVYMWAFQTLFGWYDKCDIDLVNVEMGKRFSSLSGFLHMVVNLFFRYLAQFSDPLWTQSIIDSIDIANYSGLDEDWEKVGYPLGDLIAEFFNFEIPNYDYKYGDIITTTQNLVN